jgi:hypothetical protein
LHKIHEVQLSIIHNKLGARVQEAVSRYSFFRYAFTFLTSN